jgi:hypothetical protein
MIIPPGPLKVMVATRPVDFRKGAAGLAALVEHDRLSQSVVIAVADTADRRLDSGFGEALSVLDRQPPEGPISRA